MNELVSRFRAATPLFWRKVRNLFIALAASAAAVIASNSQLDLNLSPEFIQILNYTIAIGAAVGATAQFTKEDK